MNTLGGLLVWAAAAGTPAQQDVGAILDRAGRLMEESKTAYEKARSAGSVAAFVDAGFKLEEARIKYLVVQEIGSPDQQKAAAAGLRAVNQLAKLVNDGKVAVAGGGGTPPPPTPPPPTEPAKEPGKDPALPPAGTPAARLPVPGDEAVKASVKAIRELFRDQYARKDPADRRALARLLLEQAARTQDDATSLWALLQEAQETAQQACDVRLAMAAIDAASERFDMDPLAARTAALAAAARAARSPDDFRGHAEAALDLLDELVRADEFEAADKTAAAAVQTSRRADDKDLALRANARSKEVSEAKALFQSMKRVMETLARTPDSPSANLDMGKFLCFVKGNWDLGLMFMAKGPNDPLKSLAEKELGHPAKPEERAALADAWRELGDKDRSPLRKAQLHAHARSLYESALPDATGILRLQIEKKLAEPAPSTTGTLDLLRLVKPQADSVSGTWSLAGGSLMGAKAAFARLQLPYRPPEEYDLVLALASHPGDTFLIGLVSGGRQFMVVLDSDPANGGLSGFDMVDGMKVHQNATALRGQFFLNRSGPSTIVCAVRRREVTVAVNGRKALSWQGDPARLSLDGAWKMPDAGTLFLGGYDAALSFTRIAVKPVSGPGTKLR